MGLVYTDLELSNPAEAALSAMTVRALVDCGSTFLVIPQHVADQLDLHEAEQREITLADGLKKPVPYVGPIQVRLLNRRAFVGAIVMDDEVLLGSIPMEDMDLVINPLRRAIEPNPANPNMPGAMAKGLTPRQGRE